MTPTKSANMSSATGRRPASAAPAAAPTIADSEIGVSITRSAPNFGEEPLGDAEDAAGRLALPGGTARAARHVLAQHDDARIALHLEDAARR